MTDIGLEGISKNGIRDWSDNYDEIIHRLKDDIFESSNGIGIEELPTIKLNDPKLASLFNGVFKVFWKRIDADDYLEGYNAEVDGPLPYPVKIIIDASVMILKDKLGDWLIAKNQSIASYLNDFMIKLIGVNVGEKGFIKRERGMEYESSSLLYTIYNNLVLLTKNRGHVFKYAKEFMHRIMALINEGVIMRMDVQKKAPDAKHLDMIRYIIKVLYNYCIGLKYLIGRIYSWRSSLESYEEMFLKDIQKIQMKMSKSVRSILLDIASLKLSPWRTLYRNYLNALSQPPARFERIRDLILNDADPKTYTEEDIKNFNRYIYHIHHVFLSWAKPFVLKKIDFSVSILRLGGYKPSITAYNYKSKPDAYHVMREYEKKFNVESSSFGDVIILYNNSYNLIKEYEKVMKHAAKNSIDENYKVPKVYVELEVAATYESELPKTEMSKPELQKETSEESTGFEALDKYTETQSGKQEEAKNLKTILIEEEEELEYVSEDEIVDIMTVEEPSIKQPEVRESTDITIPVAHSPHKHTNKDTESMESSKSNQDQNTFKDSSSSSSPSSDITKTAPFSQSRSSNRNFKLTLASVSKQFKKL